MPLLYTTLMICFFLHILPKLISNIRTSLFNTFTLLLLRILFQTLNGGFVWNYCRRRTPRRRRPRPQSRSPRQPPRKARRPPRRRRSRWWTRSLWLRPTSRRAANRKPENPRSARNSPWWRRPLRRAGTSPKRGPRSGDSPSGAS